MTQPKKKRGAADLHLSYPRASGFYAYANCEVSFRLSQLSGEEPPTPFSDRGTEIHGVISGKAAPLEVDPGIAEEAKHLSDLRQLDLTQWLVPDVPFTEVREKRLWFRAGVRPVFSGQPDNYVLQKRRVFLSDFKTGWHPLDDYVATNCQVRAYVALIDLDLEAKLDEVTAAIHKPGKQSPPAVFDRAAINEVGAWALDVATRALSKEANTPTRGPWCKYCAGKILCPLWQKEIQSLSDCSTAIVSDVPDSVLREMAPSLELARDVATRLIERLYARVKARPEFFSDWRFKPAPPRRGIEDVIGAYNALVVKTKAISPAEFLSACRLTLGELETRIRKNQSFSINQTRAFLDAQLTGILKRTQGKPQLVYDPAPLKEAGSGVLMVPELESTQSTEQGSATSNDQGQ